MGLCKKIKLCCLVTFLFILCGCKEHHINIGWDVLQNDLHSTPSRMVEQVDIRFIPDNPDLERHYTHRDSIDGITSIIRGMAPDISDDLLLNLNNGQSYYIVAVTYSNLKTQYCYIMGHRFLYSHEDGWSEILPEKAAIFVDYLNDHPNDCKPNSQFFPQKSPI